MRCVPHIASTPDSFNVLLLVADTCTEEQFKCDNYDCIETSQICDASHDCKDGTDESTCLQLMDAQPVVRAPGLDGELHKICARNDENEDDVIAGRLCR